jgi:type IV pilus assembly protein PilW
MWQSVISVRLTIVVRSTEDHLINAIVPYVVEGVSFTPTDHRLYKVFTTTIALRNQI